MLGTRSDPASSPRLGRLLHAVCGSPEAGSAAGPAAPPGSALHPSDPNSGRGSVGDITREPSRGPLASAVMVVVALG